MKTPPLEINMRPSVGVLCLGLFIYTVLTALINACVENQYLRLMANNATLLILYHYILLAFFIVYHNLDERIKWLYEVTERERRLERENKRRLKELKKRNKHNQ